MPTTSWGMRYPASSAAPNVNQDIQNLATDVQSFTVPRFSTAAARNAALPSPQSGQLAVVAGSVHAYDGSGWRFTLHGQVTGTTDVNGVLLITHGGGQTPTSVQLTPVGSGDTVDLRVKWVVFSVDSTYIQARAVNTNTTAYFASAAMSFYWTARF